MSEATSEEKAAMVQLFDKGVATGKSKNELNTSLMMPQVGNPVAILPDGCTIADLTKFIPAVPAYKRNNVELRSCDSFVEYVGEHKLDETRIFADYDQAEMKGEMIAYIDFDQPGGDGKAAWHHHTATYPLVFSPYFMAWHKRNGMPMSQIEFSEFVEDNRICFMKPSAAHMQEVAMTMKITSSGSCASSMRLKDGSSRFEYLDENSASASAEIPEIFELAMPVFEGTPAIKFEAMFRYRKTSNGIAYFFKLLDVQEKIKAALSDLCSSCNEATGLPVFMGKVSVD